MCAICVIALAWFMSSHFSISTISNSPVYLGLKFEIPRANVCYLIFPSTSFLDVLTKMAIITGESATDPSYQWVITKT